MIAYTHKTHPRSRSIKIKVEANGEVVVVTPKRFSQRAVDRFVSEQQSWIEAQIQKIQQKKQFTETDTTICIFGNKYQKKFVQDENITAGISIHNSSFIINTPPHRHLDKKQQQDKIDRFLRNTAEKYIVPRTHQLGEKMSTTFGKITLRQQKTRWGSCSSKGNLNFNWRLVHAPTHIIDYVIIHELAHRTHLDHSTAFWNLVEKYDPDYHKHRGWLKRHGMSVG